MVIVVEAVIKKYFTSAYRALKEKIGRLWICIYNGNDNIKVCCLIGI